mmetsp:Transcript_26130/g.38676  ORF Transcript_26130/g.38676 Transcript_26130/m.38676 type:complete len:482 (+) Transcript_26130:88-1533(+)
MSSPQPAEIIELASSCGYEERRTEVSATLFFGEVFPAHGMPPILLNIYYTTRSIMSYMNHPSSGTNEMWRSNAYKDLDELKDYFQNPRRHSGKGYRVASQATRGCVKCGTFKKRTEFSKNQWVKGPDFNKCKECVGQRNAGGSVVSSSFSECADDEASQLSDAMSGIRLDDDFPSLTEDLLQEHNVTVTQVNGRNAAKLERRQFNCPECPKHGRGKFVFFKKVPAFKPIVKCPKCKRASRGKCMRLYPVPVNSEKGYGLFKCKDCDGKWGSSRTIRNIGQECYTCKKNGKLVFVKPFRLEVVKDKVKSSGGILGGGPKRMHRVPSEPIGETDEVDVEYTENDRMRNSNAAGNALASGERYGGDTAGGLGGGSGSTYSYQERDDWPDDSGEIDEVVHAKPAAKVGVPSGYVHHCEGCASGLCKSRYLPKSLHHDVSDGNTVSTRASVVTNSSIDKTDYIDRDEDFSGFENESDEWNTVPDQH